MEIEGLWKEDFRGSVIHLDLSLLSLRRGKEEWGKYIAEGFNRALKDRGDSLSSMDFEGIRQWLKTRENRAVVLIVDEYNAPLNESFFEEEFKEALERLAEFFSLIGEFSSVFRLAFITGIVDYSYAGLFSGLKGLKNISYDPKYAAVAGFTNSKLKKYFLPGFKEAGLPLKMKEEELEERLKERYLGWRFDPDLNPDSLVYSPRDIICFFEDSGFEFREYGLLSGGSPRRAFQGSRNRLSKSETSRISAFQKEYRDGTSTAWK